MKSLFRISGVILFSLSIFLIHSCKKDKPTLPIITTTAASALMQTTATSGGNITSDGGANVTARGVCWSTTTGPTTALSTKTMDNTGTGIFTSSITALTAGTVYYVRAYATNTAGTAYGNELTFTTMTSIPGVPTGVTAIAGNTQATVTFTAPVSNGGSVITGYTVTSSPGSITGTGLVSPITVTGLTNGTAYTFTVTATNAIGNSIASYASNQVTPATIPGAPTIGPAFAGNAQATITFTAPADNGGSSITGYTVTSVPGGLTATGTASPITVTGLNNGTAYTFTVTATNAIGNGAASSATNSITPVEPVTDIDGNVYHVVTIGTQVWMAENLKTTRYNDGTAIPNVTVDATWAALTTGAYCDYGNDPANSTIYGRLYNWYTVDNNTSTKVASNGGKNVCPTGWHIPSRTEWMTLITYLGGEDVAGGKLKETGTTHWVSPNTGATNETGFTALPGGFRFYNGLDYSRGNYVFWWSSTAYSTSDAWIRLLLYNDTKINSNICSKLEGLSVRCVRDL
jgi:uncharacterized protein (TIGR02145 family)